MRSLNKSYCRTKWFEPYLRLWILIAVFMNTIYIKADEKETNYLSDLKFSTAKNFSPGKIRDVNFRVERAYSEYPGKENTKINTEEYVISKDHYEFVASVSVTVLFTAFIACIISVSG